jgi:plasmid stabilization system protein ParE
MSYRVVVGPRAEREIRLAAHWILGRSGSRATAVRWARKLRATIATLKVNPKRCPVDPDSEVYGEAVRVLLHGKRRGVYRVLSTIRRDTVHVLAVRHSAQRSLADELAEDEPGEAGDPVHRSEPRFDMDDSKEILAASPFSFPSCVPVFLPQVLPRLCRQVAIVADRGFQQPLRRGCMPGTSNNLL